MQSWPPQTTLRQIPRGLLLLSVPYPNMIGQPLVAITGNCQQQQQGQPSMQPSFAIQSSSSNTSRGRLIGLGQALLRTQAKRGIQRDPPKIASFPPTSVSLTSFGGGGNSRDVPQDNGEVDAQVEDDDADRTQSDGHVATAPIFTPFFSSDSEVEVAPNEVAEHPYII